MVTKESLASRLRETIAELYDIDFFYYLMVSPMTLLFLISFTILSISFFSGLALFLLLPALVLLKLLGVSLSENTILASVVILGLIIYYVVLVDLSPTAEELSEKGFVIPFSRRPSTITNKKKKGAYISEGDDDEPAT